MAFTNDKDDVIQEKKVNPFLARRKQAQDNPPQQTIPAPAPIVQEEKVFVEPVVETVAAVEVPIINTNIELPTEAKNEKPHYDGLSIEDLEKSGVNTLNALKAASDKVKETKYSKEEWAEVKTVVNSLVLADVLSFFGAKERSRKEEQVIYRLQTGQGVSVKEDKWYSYDDKKGGTGAIGLTALILMKENNAELNDENSRLYFTKAVHKLNEEKTNILEKRTNNAPVQPTLEKQESPSNVEPSVAPISDSLPPKVDVPVVVKEEKPAQAEPEVQVNNYAAFKVLAEKVDLIQLKEVMTLLDGQNNEDKIRNKYKMPWGDNVSLNGQKWYNHNANKGGVGAVTLMKHSLAKIERLDEKDKETSLYLFKKAVRDLAEFFGEKVDNAEIMAAEKDFKREKKDFSPPKSLPSKMDKVKHYLVNQRNIPEWLIDKQIKAGKIYAGVPDWADYWIDKPKPKSDDEYPDDRTYCVFLSKGTAECRCIVDTGNDVSSKGQATGSLKRQYGFTVMPEKGSPENIVTITEGAIDAMSYHALYPQRFAISSSGVDNLEFMIKVALETIDNDWTFSLALDNDRAGHQTTEDFKKEMQRILTEEKYNKLVEENKIIFEVPSYGKDWNETLKKQKQALKM